MYGLLRFVPKNHMSHLIGVLAHAPMPKSISALLIRWFIGRYGVRVEDAANPPSEYPTLGEFFIRDLKPDIRPLGHGVVSPVDGALAAFGEIESGKALQVKGKLYSVAKLLGDQDLSQRYRQGYYLNFYLAPGDYHHIHSPVDGTITDAYHIPGKLWPVNEWSLQHVEHLFSTNERVVTVIDSKDWGRVCVVKVGATNVGCVCTTYDTLRGNQKPKFFGQQAGMTHKSYAEGIEVRKGERIGTFRMGSTVVLLFEEGRFVPGAGCKEGPLHYGESLG